VAVGCGECVNAQGCCGGAEEYERKRAVTVRGFTKKVCP
jgi:hypothetical protein